MTQAESGALEADYEFARQSLAAASSIFRLAPRRGEGTVRSGHPRSFETSAAYSVALA